MARLAFFFSGVLCLLGIITMLTTKVINLVMPKIGLAAFQSSLGGTYDSSLYHIDFSTVNRGSLILIVGGLILSVLFFSMESDFKEK